MDDIQLYNYALTQSEIDSLVDQVNVALYLKLDAVEPYTITGPLVLENAS